MLCGRVERGTESEWCRSSGKPHCGFHLQQAKDVLAAVGVVERECVGAVSLTGIEVN